MTFGTKFDMYAPLGEIRFAIVHVFVKGTTEAEIAEKKPSTVLTRKVFHLKIRS